jgi:hypothetical protein
MWKRGRVARRGVYRQETAWIPRASFLEWRL